MNSVRPHEIRFGIFDHLDDSGREPGQQYSERLRLAEACDQAGFRGYHVAEHHGTPHGLAPSPNLFLSAVAQRTRRLRIGPMVMLLNLYHPLRALEEICMLDHMSGGRVDLGIGRGAPIELGFFGVPAEEAQDRYIEASDILLGAMMADTADYHGRFHQLDDVPLSLAPLQRPHPPLWYGTARADTAVWAAGNGMNIACVGKASAVRQMTDAYRAAWSNTHPSEGAMPLLGMVRHVVIGATINDAYALALPAYSRWAETFTALSRSRGLPPPPNFPGSFEQALEEGHIIVGDSSVVRDALKRQTLEAGINYLMCAVAFGDLPLAVSLKTVAAIAAEIMPAFDMLEAA